jgi:hypothetical protein
MELGKYKLAMRPKKYLTREFVVYKAAPEAMDDVITEEQNTIDTMPSQAPVIDNYMPEMQGMEDPSLRQVELAEGGTPAGKKTEKITRVGKPVYETSEGEMMSEQSRTLKLGNLYYNVPSIHDGKKYTDEQLVELLNKNLISPTSVHSSLEGALDESKFRSSTLFDTEEDYGQQLSAREGSFADGGVVQREGFDQGGDVKKLKKYLSNDRNKFITEFTKYTNKYFYGNLKRAAESIGERRNKIRAIYERKGIKNSGYGSKTPTEVFVGGEKPEDFSTKLKKEPNILDKFKNKDTFVDANVLAKKFGVDVSTKNKRDVFIGFLKRAGVDKQNFSGKMNLYNIGDAAKKLPETFKNKKVKGETLANSQRVSIESELDPDLKNFKQRVIKEIGKVSNKFDIYIPNAVEDVGHAVSIKQASKYPNLFKNSNTVSLQSLVFQDPEINRQILSKNMEGKFDSVYKELNDLVDKKITPESRAKLIQLNKKLSNLRNETISKIKNLSKENKYFKGQEKRIPLIEIDLPKIGETFKSQNLKANMSVVDDYYRYGNIDQINPTANKLADLSPKELSQFENKVISQYSDNAKKYYLASGFPQKEVSELGEMIDTRVANERIDTQVGEKKIKTIVENIGCPTGSLKAANGANCYIKGAEKIQAGKLNQNEFNVLQKAVKSPAVAKAVKYGGVALKGLGALFAPLMVYDTYTEYKKGKPISEALEYGLLGTNIIGGTRDELKLTPREREARGVQQQYEREQQDVSGLSSDFYFPSDLSVDQAAKIYEQGQDRVAAERAAEEKQAALENVYQGDPGILDYSEYAYGGRVGLAAGTIPRAVNWVAKRIQEINKLIKTKRAKAEDFLDEIEILNKAEELNLTKEQVGQILRQQKQAATEKYLKRPIEGDPDLESRLPYDPNATPGNIKKRKNVYGKYEFTGNESLEDLYELERLGKITRMDMNVYDPRYVEWLDAQIINKEELYTPKEWENTPEVLKNKMRGRIDPDWETANFGEDFDWDRARSTEIQQTQKLKDFDVTGRSKNSSAEELILKKEAIQKTNQFFLSIL